MTKYNFYRISNSKKIRYLKKHKKNGPYIVFLHGFMSDLDGKKPKAFLNFAKKNNLGFLALEYSGHGKSSGKFTDGNISIWSNETYLLIKKIIKKNNFVLIGSSMGAWISLNQFKFFKKQIKGFLGIGSAPEFLENLMWNKFSKINNEIVAASDAFFPFVDGIEKLVQSGASAIVQPAGSIRDKEIIKFANETNTVLVFSKTRHFRH